MHKRSSTNSVGKERRNLRALRNNVIPSVLSALIVIMVTWVLKYGVSIINTISTVKDHKAHITSLHTALGELRKSVNRHNHDLEHFKAQCHIIDEKIKDINVIRDRLVECRKDIDRLERKIRDE